MADTEGLRPGSLHWGVAPGGGVLQKKYTSRIFLHGYEMKSGHGKAPCSQGFRNVAWE